MSLERETHVPLPARVMGAAIFRGFDQRSMQEIAQAGRLVTLATNDRLYASGDACGPFFVVATGRISIRGVRRDEDRETQIREVLPGECFGEEAVVWPIRRAAAFAEEPSTVLEVPVHLFRRAAIRSGKAELADRLERTLRRAATRDLVLTSIIGARLDEVGLDLILDGATHHTFARGQVIYRDRDPAKSVFIIADGRVQLQTDDGERVRVRAYLGRGDFFGDEEVDENLPRAASAVASGPVTLISIPREVTLRLSSRDPELFSSLRRAHSERAQGASALVRGAAQNATQHAFRDLYRLEIARSLLVIDLETCVRCGHCSWACGELYGTPRLIRRGDKMVVRTDDIVPPAAAEAEPPQETAVVKEGFLRHLMLPNSCQHCESPACMADCPTGAIGKDLNGEVFIREELCTGCGACVRGCPWGNVQMQERPKAMARPQGHAAIEVAQKCDLCRTVAEGPACVRACPVNAIMRIDPSLELPELRVLFGDRVTRTPDDENVEGSTLETGLRRDLGFFAGAVIAALSLGIVGALMHARAQLTPRAGLGFAAGVLTLVLFLALVAYAAPKRLIRAGSTFRRAPSRTKEAGKATVRSTTRPHLAAHVAIGLVATGFAFVHAPLALHGTTGSTLFILMLIACGAGALLTLAYLLVPRTLARIERTATLPEDFARETKALEDRLYRSLSGKNEVVKRLADRILLPYARSRVGPLLLVLSRRTLHAEQVHLRQRIENLLGGRGHGKLQGLEDLVRVTVEIRALPAQRWLAALLRWLLPVHVVSFAITLVLLALHVVEVLR